MSEYRDLLTAATQLARDAGAILCEAYDQRASVVTSKSTLIDLVTDTDRAAEDLLIAGIHHSFPDHGILAEESGAQGGQPEFRWVIDPLDGTVNFAHRIPVFAVLLAVQRRQGDRYQTEVGVTYDPLRDELFTTMRGHGATLNNQPIRVSSTPRLIDAIGSTGFRYDRLFRGDDNHAEYVRMNLLTQGIRRLGSAGLELAYLAAGRLDIYWEYGLNPWDVAAGLLMVEEAGGTATGLGDPDAALFGGDLAASNGVLHESFLAALGSAKGRPAASREGLEEHLPEELVKQLSRAEKRD